MSECECGNEKKSSSARCASCHFSARKEEMTGPEKHCTRCNRRMKSVTRDVCRVCLEGPLVPREAILPWLKELVAERHFMFQKDEPAGGTIALSVEAGVLADSLNKILRGDQGGLAYATVDRLLTKTGNPLLWYTEHLAPYFDEKFVVERQRAAPKKSVLSACLDCGVRLNRSRTTRCYECYIAHRRASAKTLCECGAEIQSTSKMCRPCFDQSRREAGKNQRKWVAGESWQVA